jgi:hypothetical protein
VESEGFRREDETMKAAEAAQASAPATIESRRGRLRYGQWRQIALITAGAIGLFAFMRWLPTGTNLSHMDFRVEAKNSIAFCDPHNPAFIPVVAVPSPVAMKVAVPGVAEAAAGVPVDVTLTLKTASGKPIAPEDLLVVHTERLHLMVTDPSLTDYQHIHPKPGRRAGDWVFSFTPRFGGVYRMFADFTPAATGLGLYANADLNVAGAAAVAREPEPNIWRAEEGGYRFALTPAARPVRVRQPADLAFTVTRVDGGRVPLEPVMGAFAHLVAFDRGRSGFAHIHPAELDVSKPPADPIRPTLHFKVSIPRAGRYVIWAQVNLAGRMTFAPFWFDVVE